MKNIEQEEKIIKETKELVELFLQTNASDIELSKMTGISSSTVGRRLTNTGNILKAFPDKGESLAKQIKEKRQENLKQGKALGGQTTLLNHVYLNTADAKFNSSTRLRLDVLSKDENTVYRILMHAALTFRLHPDTMSDMFQIDEKELYKKLLNVAGNCYEAMMFLFYHDARDQNKAKEEFLNFYRELLNAIRNKDIDDKRRIMSMISDAKAAEFKNRERKSREIMTDDEVLTLVKYHIKYALRTRAMENLFRIHHTTYIDRVYAVLENYDELKSLYEYLADYNKKKYYEVIRKG